MDLRNLSDDELRVECDKQMAECLEEQRKQGFSRDKQMAEYHPHRRVMQREERRKSYPPCIQWLLAHGLLREVATA